ncbi:hypothetical protein C1752_02065 [Acaryochloris thomasi RCC1774]|uniref:Chromosome partition protein Smc n=1 Tax=Acaryochloris thomasi RCC1774 TaxID=1764569 RepID=A0A2W1JUW6_9CYAN|nr:hypothetical protein [Acaryochloris thomasi]PZD73554.1 hypothetical protein C1752_02065 [Acaryochloris thomasi RCC1774]
MATSRDPKDHPQYQYWSSQVALRNRVLILSSEDMPVYELRHRCTNYDDLLESAEFQALEGADRVAAYHALHYTATMKPLRHREYQVAEQRNQLLEKKAKYEKAQKEIKKLLKEKAIQQDEQEDYIKRLEKINETLVQDNRDWEQVNSVLKTANLELREECDRIRQDYEQALTKIKALEKDLGKEKEHRARLAKNNQSLGSYKGHFNTQKAKNVDLQKEIGTLKVKLQNVQRYAEEIKNPELREMAQF